jgi:signal transduction histidine kinase
MATLWPIVRESFASAPAPIRAQIRWVGALWVVLVALQIWDSADGRGAAGVAEFLSAVLASTGAALLGVAHALQRTMEEAASRPRPPKEAVAVQQVLLALPAFGFAAGVVLGGAAMLMLMRALLGTEIALAIIASTSYILLVAFAAFTVMRSVRTLYLHAEQQAASAAQARTDAAEARFAALSARMNPHFLFNALNTVAALVRTDPRAAERSVESLSGVLRRTLDRSSESMGTVGEEVEYVSSYLDVEQQRWGDRLRVEWRVDPETLALPLPPFVLQPLVENALHHGLGAKTQGGRLVIRIARDGDRLTVTVEDDGEGFVRGYKERTGLSGLRQRLAALYGDSASVAIESSPGGLVVVSLPIGGVS